MRIIENLEVWGHPNITGRNRTTFEFTKDVHLTLRGDCVIGIKSSKGASDLSPEFKDLATNPSAVINVRLVVDGLETVMRGRGSPALTFSHPTDLVGRRSLYTCGRTLMIGSDKVAKDLPRDLVGAMRNPLRRAHVELTVRV